MFSARLVSIASILVASIAISGCSGVIHKRINTDNGKGLSLGARQRVVLVTKFGGKDGKRQIVCAEPSPDVFAVRAASASFAMKGIFGGQPSSKEGQQSAANAGFSTSESAATISRTQTIQLLRDGLFRLCEAYMNGAVDKTQYNVALVNMDKLMTSLLAIDTIGGTAFPPIAGITASSKSSSGGGLSEDEVQKILSEGGTIVEQAKKIAENSETKVATSATGTAAELAAATHSTLGANNEEASRVIGKIAADHRRPGDKAAAFIAMCVGIMNGAPSQLTNSQQKLINQCNAYLASSRDPRFILALSGRSSHYEPYYGGEK